jgi:putative PIN family toxin of toxin-antitoxin system
MIPKRIVIDTNVCLDLFVFRDPRWALLLAALENGTIEAVTREDCRMEWRIVLGYPHLPLNDQTRQQSSAEFDRLITYVAPEPITDQLLPRCIDSDDQKFLELARDSGADVLITKDKALLKLARKTVKSGLFQIIQPEAWESVSLLPIPFAACSRG